MSPLEIAKDAGVKTDWTINLPLMLFLLVQAFAAVIYVTKLDGKIFSVDEMARENKTTIGSLAVSSKALELRQGVMEAAVQVRLDSISDTMRRIEEAIAEDRRKLNETRR